MHHVHHIVPKHHLGYHDNSPDNLTPPISVALHAALHKDLYEHSGLYGDLMAWKMLSGQSMKGVESWNKGKTGVYSEDTKAAIGKAQRGRKRSPEQRSKQSQALLGKNTWSKGRALSEEHKRRLSASLMGRPGKPHSDDSKQKLRDANKGQVPWNKGKTGVYSDATLSVMRGQCRSAETKHKISNSAKGNTRSLGRVMSEETRRKISESLKKRAALVGA